MKYLWILLITTTLLSACGSSDDEPEPPISGKQTYWDQFNWGDGETWQ